METNGCDRRKTGLVLLCSRVVAAVFTSFTLLINASCEGDLLYATDAGI